MYTQSQMMENYNYYNDPRVRASMRHSVWSVAEQGRDRVVVEFDGDWFHEVIIGDLLDNRIGEMLENGDPITERLRLASMIMDYYAMKRKLEEQNIQQKSYTARSYALRDRLRTNFESISRVYQDEYEKISEHLSDFIRESLENLGFRDGKMELNSRYEICEMCSGSGKVVRPEIDAGGLSREDFCEDPDFEHDYFSGHFDVSCPQCGGIRVEVHPCFPEWLQKLIDDHDADDIASVAERCAELRMGA